jgi:hypothetical protein
MINPLLVSILVTCAARSKHRRCYPVLHTVGMPASTQDRAQRSIDEQQAYINPVAQHETEDIHPHLEQYEFTTIADF